MSSFWLVWMLVFLFAFVVLVSFFWFPSLSAGGECLGRVHSSSFASVLSSLVVEGSS